MKNILYIEPFTGETAVGGSTISLFHLVTHMRRDLYKPLVLFFYPNKMAPVFREKGIRVFDINSRFDHTKIKPLHATIGKYNGNHSSPRASKPIYEAVKSIWHNLPNLKNIRIITRIIKAYDIHLVHQNNGIRRNMDGFYAAYLNNIPIVCHDREVPGPISAHHRLLAKRVNKIICISDALKSNYISGHLPANMISVVNNSVDLQNIRHKKTPEAIRKELGIPADAFLIGNVGTITPWKGQEIAVKAMQMLNGSCNGTYCVFVGDAITERGRIYKERLQGLISRLDLNDRLKFIGFKENIFDYINAFDLLIHTSIKPEPFGRIIIEAMAKKRVIIAANAGGVPEIIRHNYNGLLYEPGNAVELAAWIECCYHNSPLLRDLGENGFTQVSKRYAIDYQIRKIERIYSDILS